MPEMTKTKRPRLSRSDLSDKIFYLFIYVFLGFLALVILYPLYFIIFEVKGIGAALSFSVKTNCF